MTPDIHINIIFSDTVFSIYKNKRYGMKTCSAIIDVELADDLMQIYKRLKEMENCGCIMPGFCSLQKVEERINTI
jgi:hypothetical protein